MAQHNTTLLDDDEMQHHQQASEDYAVLVAWLRDHFPCFWAQRDPHSPPSGQIIALIQRLRPSGHVAADASGDALSGGAYY